MVVDELVAILGYEVRGEDKLRRFSQSIDRAAANLVRFAAVAGTAAATAMGVLGRSVINTSAEFEGYAATLETIEGSSEKAQASLDWISDFAKKTPFEVSELTEAFVRLRAYGMDPTQGLMESLGDASSGMGKSLMQAVEMIADASTGEFERIKEFGIKAKQEGDNVTFSWSQNGKDLSKTVKKTGTEITKFIQEQFGARFGGAMMRQSKTWNGMMSNLSDGWVDFQRRVGDAGFFESVKAQLGRAMDFIGRLDADGTLDRWAKNLSDAFTWAADGVVRFGQKMGRHFETVSGIIEDNKETWDWLKWVLLGIGVWLAPIPAAFIAAGFALDEFLTYFRGGKSIIGDFVEYFKGINWEDLGKQAGDGLIKGLGAVWDDIMSTTISFGWDSAGQKAGSEFGSAFFKAFSDLVTGFFNELGLRAAKAIQGAIESVVPHWMMNPGITLSAPGNKVEDQKAQSWKEFFLGDAADPNFVFKDAMGIDIGSGQQLLRNAEGNMARAGNDNAAASVESTVNDSRNQSVKVDVGGVTVTQAVQAPAAVGQAVGNAAASAAKGGLPPTRLGGGGGF